MARQSEAAQRLHESRIFVGWSSVMSTLWRASRASSISLVPTSCSGIYEMSSSVFDPALGGGRIRHYSACIFIDIAELDSVCIDDPRHVHRIAMHVSEHQPGKALL